MVDEGDLILRREFGWKKSAKWPKRLILLSALPRASWSELQRLSFEAIPGKTGVYIDASKVFPTSRQDEEKNIPKILPPNPEERVKFAAKLSKKSPVLYWGKSSEYSKYAGWPKEADMVIVAAELRNNPSEFLAGLRVAKSGFFFFEADNNRDLQYLRAWDYRSSTSQGLSLFLAAPFDTKSTFLQAQGRICRGSDEG